MFLFLFFQTWIGCGTTLSAVILLSKKIEANLIPVKAKKDILGSKLAIIIPSTSFHKATSKGTLKHFAQSEGKKQLIHPALAQGDGGQVGRNLRETQTGTT